MVTDQQNGNTAVNNANEGNTTETQAGQAGETGQDTFADDIGRMTNDGQEHTPDTNAGNTANNQNSRLTAAGIPKLYRAKMVGAHKVGDWGAHV